MTPKDKINYFVVGHLADITITYLSLTHFTELHEAGSLGNSTIMSDDARLLSAKIAVVALVVGLYALGRNKSGKIEYVSRKTLEIGTVITYIALAFNASQILPFVVQAMQMK